MAFDSGMLNQAKLQQVLEETEQRDWWEMEK